MVGLNILGALDPCHRLLSGPVFASHPLERSGLFLVLILMSRKVLGQLGSFLGFQASGYARRGALLPARS